MSRPTSAAAAFAKLAHVNDYFRVGTGPVDGDWRPVQNLYTDPQLLDGVIDRVRTRLGADEQRVAASIFFLGFAARLWSIGLGAVVGYHLLPDLAPEQLLFREVDGAIELHVQHPDGLEGENLAGMLADLVLDSHLTPLSTALQPVSREVLRGNAASALLGAARAFDLHQGSGLAWQLARRLCTDERLSGTVRFTKASYRRTSCCLYYRTRGGGLCGDCALTHVPGIISRKDAS
jgi:iron complex transport system ATP-binding protein